MKKIKYLFVGFIVLGLSIPLFLANAQSEEMPDLTTYSPPEISFEIMKFKIKNQGAAEANNFVTTVEIGQLAKNCEDPSKCAELINYKEACSYSTEELNSGEEKFFTCEYRKEVHYPYTYTARLTVDANKDIEESNEQNNKQLASFQVECAEAGEKVNRNPVLGPTGRQCCSRLFEDKVSRSYSICREEEINKCEQEGGYCINNSESCKEGYQEVDFRCNQNQKCCYHEGTQVLEETSITISLGKISISGQQQGSNKNFEVNKNSPPVAAHQKDSTVRVSEGGKKITFQDSKKNQITIRPGQQKSTIESETVKAETNLELKIKDQSLNAITSKGEQKVGVTPNQVRERIQQKTKSEVEKMNLKETKSGGVSYEANGSRKSKLFGLFPVKQKISTQVNASSGKVEKVKKPWWSFMASK